MLAVVLHPVLLLLVDFLSCGDGVLEVDRDLLLTNIIVAIRARLTMVAVAATMAAIFDIDIIVQFHLNLVVVDDPRLLMLTILVVVVDVVVPLGLVR